MLLSDKNQKLNYIIMRFLPSVEMTNSYVISTKDRNLKILADSDKKK